MESGSENLPAGVSMQEYMAIIRRRRMIILQAFVLISVVGVVLTLMQKPVYQASAKLLVEGPSYNLNTVDANNPLSSLFELSQQQTVDTQVEVLQAQPLLDAVTKQVGPAALSVATVKDTNVIEVMAESTDPRTAADAPNTLLKMFIDQDTNQSLAEMERARQFVESQGKVAHDKLNASETALRDFKQKNHTAELIKSRDDAIASVNELSGEYGKATTDLIVLRAQIAADRSLLAAGAGDHDVPDPGHQHRSSPASGKNPRAGSPAGRHDPAGRPDPQCPAGQAPLTPRSRRCSSALTCSRP